MEKEDYSMKHNNILTITTDTVYATDVDLQANPLTIWTNTSLAASRALPLFLRTSAELIENGFAFSLIHWNELNHHNVIFCTDANNNILGGMVWEYRQVINEAWIALSFTSPEFRGRRINQLMHKYLIEISVKRGANKIGSHVHVNNTARLKSAERVGLVPQFYRMSQSLI